WMQERLLVAVCVIVLFSFAAASAVFPITSGDVWWHIATGNYILTHKSVPKYDVFSFSSTGNRWVTHEWLFEVLIALLFRFGGTNALILLNTALVLATLTMLLATLRRSKVDMILALPLLMISIPLLTFRAFVRPHVTTETLFALYVFVLFCIITTGNNSKFSWLWLLVPVQLFWTNLHSGAIFGPMLFMTAGVFALFVPSISRNCNESKLSIPIRLLAFGGTLAGISLINPNGWQSLAYPFFLTRSRTFTSAITELWSPLTKQYWGSDFLICFLLILSLGLVSLFRNRRRNLVFMFLFGIATVAACLALRNIPLFTILAIPITGFHLNPIVGFQLKHKLRLPVLWLATLVGTLLLARTLMVGTKLPNGFRKTGLGIDKRSFPIGAADFIADNHHGGNIFNTMEHGGYLLWRLFPRFRVYVDGRLDVYGASLFEKYRQALWSGSQFDSIVDEHSVDCVLLANPPSLDTKTELYLGRTLALRPDWSLVYWDDNSLVYFRHTEPNRSAIEKHRFSAIIPVLLWPNFPISDTSLLLREALRSVSAAPSSSKAHVVLGFALLWSGRWHEAAQEFERALAIDPANIAAVQGRAMVAAYGGNLDSTVAALKHLSRLAPREPLVHYNLGYALLQRGESTAARREFELALRIDIKIVPAHNALAELALAEGDTARAIEHTYEVLRLNPHNPYAVSRLRRLRGLRYPSR
ncbi:MAG: tetratricopeptide repeat protein, partial [candidate division WOR-3 bacterium]